MTREAHDGPAFGELALPDTLRWESRRLQPLDQRCLPGRCCYL